MMMSKRDAVFRVPLNGLARSSDALAQQTEDYAGFRKLDGTHPWQQAAPEGYVAYPVRRLKGGRVTFFNFELAKEMGLIPRQHGQNLTSSLEEMILDTFCLQIINEFDQLHSRRFDPKTIKPNRYMATRYLQLQHSDKRGRTSGDGRSIWNGAITHNGCTWDVSSRGTGVTTLAPGAVEAKQPLKTGNEDFGYGCGMADVDELMGSAIMSEIFHYQGINTERVLTIIDIGGGLGIGVRAAQNLLRPAHLFAFLKQRDHKALKKATDYFISRQLNNKAWVWPKNKNRYQLLALQFAQDFAKFAAKLERNYIFVWLDWDGDNVLANSGIIDYGSVRQFGLRHDSYRYDDVTRYSTCLNEQQDKARNTVKVFVQLCEYLRTGKYRAISKYKNHTAVKAFNTSFQSELRREFLRQIGLSDIQAQTAMSKHVRKVENLMKAFGELESVKTLAPTRQLPDGINRPAIFNMRAFLRELPGKIDAPTRLAKPMTSAEFIQITRSQFAKKKDLQLNTKREKQISCLLAAYTDLTEALRVRESFTSFYGKLKVRAEKMNLEGRITGNSIEYLVEELLKSKRRGLTPMQTQLALEQFVAYQTPLREKQPAKLLSLSSETGRLFQRLINIAVDFQEDI